MATDPELRSHLEWLGYIQPVGLVVSPAALLAAGVVPDRNVAVRQAVLRDLLEGEPPGIPDFASFAKTFLDWRDSDLAGSPGGPDLPESLSVPLPNEHDTLRPDHAVPDPDGKEGEARWLLLVSVYPPGTQLDEAGSRSSSSGGWHASPEARMERLLRETGVPAGILWNGTELRLVAAPKGESAGWLTFVLPDLCTVAGRPLCSALLMLLSAERLFSVPTPQRLPALLRVSRKYQNDVSTRLSGQVLDALHELVRGFQAANESTGGALLKGVLAGHSDEVYGGLLTTLLRLVFVLYAEDRGLISQDPVYAEHYSVGGLFAKLRDDAALYPDTMDQRFGAWSRLLTLFRLLHDGASHAGLSIPPRHGSLFEPDAYPFLEGRERLAVSAPGERVSAPRVSDGVVWRVLERLLVLDGERLSYRALDVEQIGSVYEAIMGFSLRVASGPVIAVRSRKKGSAVDVHFETAELLALSAADQVRRLKDEADCALSGEPLERWKGAKTPDELAAALAQGKKLSPRTQRPLPAGSLYLQPTEERRRSGSHYTPRSLTEPIVRTTLEPVLAALGESPKPEQVLGLKVCDPAMGSGAFLVETCRYLGDALLRAWDSHGGIPETPSDEDPLLFARRQVAQRCLYGVDKNPFAVDLAKLSLWLATLAKDHPFTFLDDSLRHGDSLVGLSPAQIGQFHWETKGQAPLVGQALREAQERAIAKRAEIETLNDGDVERQMALLADAEAALADVRLAGDLVIAAFFGAAKDKEREALRKRYENLYFAAISDPANLGDRVKAEKIAASLREGEKPVFPLHWELAFPEVFARENPGFDAIVGNPPFLGGFRVSNLLGMSYFQFLTVNTPSAGHLCDLVAYFFRRAFCRLRQSGCMGLIATNSIAQGDTRNGGLRWICQHDGRIFGATRRLSWPGAAAVVVSVVHVSKGEATSRNVLDGKPVLHISAYLFPSTIHSDPARLAGQNDLFSQGANICGLGFLFDDSDPEANRTALMRTILRSDSSTIPFIRPYIGGEEFNRDPAQQFRRYVIDLNHVRTEPELRRWPLLEALLRDRVKPERDALGTNPNNARLKRRWWAFHAERADFYAQARTGSRLLAVSVVTPRLAFAFVPADWVHAYTLNLFALDQDSAFALLQSRPHEAWARFLGSSMKDDLRYTPSDCFETFPLPLGWKIDPTLSPVGKGYYDFRAALMIRNNEGLTKTYNRFHDPDETSADIVHLRVLHDEMDRAVLDAYGWTDLLPTCEFLLDYEDEDDEDDDSGRSRKRKKPWRYRWSDDIRNEVLARLLALNKERAEEEVLRGSAAAEAPKAPRRQRRAP